LLGWLTDAAKGVVTTSEEKIADVNSNAPVGTTQALIEQGAAVFSAIHARLHDSQKRVLKSPEPYQSLVLDDMHINESVSDLEIKREDFAKNGRCHSGQRPAHLQRDAAHGPDPSGHCADGQVSGAFLTSVR